MNYKFSDLNCIPSPQSLNGPFSKKSRREKIRVVRFCFIRLFGAKQRFNSFIPSQLLFEYWILTPSPTKPHHLLAVLQECVGNENGNLPQGLRNISLR